MGLRKAMGLAKLSKVCSFLKERTKELLLVLGVVLAIGVAGPGGATTIT